MRDVINTFPRFSGARPYTVGVLIMAGELLFDGKKFLSSSGASKVAGYSPDYVSQLCREGKLVCRRIGKSWFVEEHSLHSYKALGLNHDPSKAIRLLKGKAPERAPVPETLSPAHAQGELACGEDAGLAAQPSLSLQVLFPVSAEFWQKVGTLALSTALVFGTYHAKDTQVFHSAVHKAERAVESSPGAVRGLAELFLNHPDAALEVARDNLSRLAHASSKLSASVFETASNAIGRSADDLRSEVAGALTALRERQGLFAGAVASGKVDSLLAPLRSAARGTYAFFNKEAGAEAP